MMFVGQTNLLSTSLQNFNKLIDQTFTSFIGSHIKFEQIWIINVNPNKEVLQLHEVTYCSQPKQSFGKLQIGI